MKETEKKEKCKSYYSTPGIALEAERQEEYLRLETIRGYIVRLGFVLQTTETKENI